MVGKEEFDAVKRVFKRNIFSGYLAGTLTGGPEVEALEREWEEYFKVKHAIAVNSATSGLFCVFQLFTKKTIATTPFSMSASATMPFYTNKIKFIDIDEHFLIEKTDNNYVLAVDLFGQPFDIEKFDVSTQVIIEDASQAIGAKYGNKYAGTLGDIGIFSLNYHKHIHCGEGGIIVTNDDEKAYKLRLLRNHGEVLEKMFGFNFRLTEIQAAIAREQLKKLSNLLNKRIDKVEYVLENLSNNKNLELPTVGNYRTHVYYLTPIKIKENRNSYIKKLNEKGITHSVGYNKPLHFLPLFDNKEHFYNTEKAYNELICLSITSETSINEINNIIRIFKS